MWWNYLGTDSEWPLGTSFGYFPEQKSVSIIWKKVGPSFSPLAIPEVFESCES